MARKTKSLSREEQRRRRIWDEAMFRETNAALECSERAKPAPESGAAESKPPQPAKGIDDGKDK